MSLTELYVKIEYNSIEDDVVNDFYVPCLERAVNYKRAVGFFSSSALVDIAKGISGLIKNNGSMQLIVSPELSDEDVEAIQRGYDARKKVEEVLVRDFTDVVAYEDKQRLSWLAYLIESNRLDIKVAFMTNNALFHIKVGIISDASSNKIAFSGSMNETTSGHSRNFDQFDTYCSWKTEDVKRIKKKESDFDNLWGNNTQGVEVINFPEIAREKLKSYYNNNEPLDLDLDKRRSFNVRKGPSKPDSIKLYDYQEEAIAKWKACGYRGIFDMATGTGKTYTALAAAVQLLNDEKNVAIIVVCPYQHLVDQWVEDIVKFGFEPIIGYSSSNQKDWKTRLKNSVIDYNCQVIPSFLLVTTVATYCSKYVTEQINRIQEKILLIVDEAHNMGASKAQNYLHEKIECRLALSATIERHNDESGTSKLTDYFGEKCIEYSLKKAIYEGKLTSYKYYPKVISLTDDEFDEYKSLTLDFIRCCWNAKLNKIVINERGKQILIARSRVIAGARNKVLLLEKLLQQYKDRDHILVYCGTSVIRTYDSDSSGVDEDGERQIDAVSKMMGQKLGMSVRHFTSRETAQEREIIKEQFDKRDPYQALVAIKCLDEGVNIPSVKTAFILASCTNPKEYIQRRGRVLRTAPGKKEAEIYDFITLPRPIEDVYPDDENRNIELGLVKREISRVLEFMDSAINTADSDKLINEILGAYNTSLYSLDKEESYEYEY